MFFRISPFWEAIGITGSVIIGSGIFILPYAVGVSGFWAALGMGALAFFLVLSIHLAYGEIVTNTKARHRLPGYAELYLGKFAGALSKTSELLLFNAVLLTYGILGGQFLFVVFGGNAMAWSLLFFAAAASVLFYSRVERIGSINFLIMSVVVLMELGIAFFSFRAGSFSNLPLYGSDPFFSFGVFVFALAGLSIIADAREIFRRGNIEHKLKSVIILITSLPLLLYFIFAASVLMATGMEVTKDVFSGLSKVLGSRVIMVGAFISAFSMFSSFLALGYDLKKIYELDLALPKLASWVLVALLPAVIFLLTRIDFVKLVSIVGGVFIAIDGILVFFILKKMRAQGLSRVKFLPFGFWQRALLLITLTLSIVYEIIYQIL